MPEPNDGKHRVRLKSGFGCKKAAAKEEATASYQMISGGNSSHN